MKLRRIDEGDLNSFFLEQQIQAEASNAFRRNLKIPLSRSIEVIMDKSTSLKNFLFKPLEL